MKQIFALTAIALILAGCSSKPNKDDILDAFTSELQADCREASVSNVEVMEIVMPNSSNTNRVNVTFTADVMVKMSKQYADAYAQSKKGTELRNNFEATIKDKFAEEKALVASLKDIIENGQYKNAAWLESQGISSENMGSEKQYNDIIDFKSALQKELDKALNDLGLKRIAAAEDYAKASNGLLTMSANKYPAGGAQFVGLLESPPPEFPAGCMGYAQQSALTMLRWQNNKAAGSDYGDKQRYIDGESGNFKMERIMLKSDKGWVFSR